MLFSIRALSKDNAITVLELEADGEAQLRRQLAERALVPIHIRKVLLVRTAGAASSRGRFQLLLFAQELLALLNAGLGLVESLEALSAHSGHGDSRRVLEELLGKLRAGHAFASALASQPAIFPALLRGLVHAGEGSGGLQQALSRYIDYQQRVEAVRSTVINALVYPAILAVVGFGVTAFLLVYVVPRFAAVYQGTGRALPWLTEQMLAWGRVASEHTGLVTAALLGAGAAAGLALWRGLRTGGLVQVLLRLPLIGHHLQLYALSRLYLTLSMLLGSGMPIRSAIDAAASVLPVGSRRQLVAARDDVVAGQAVSVALNRHGLTTEISTRLLQAGEQSGELARMLEQAAAFYEGANARFLQRFTRAFEPLLMVLIGLVVGLIVLLLYMPIFDLAGSLQ